MEIRPILSALLRQKTGPLLVAIQVAISLAILANALFIVHERIIASQRPSGVYDEPNVGYLQVFALEKRSHQEKLAAQQRELQALRGVPGIKSVSFTSQMPMSRSGSSGSVRGNPRSNQETGNAGRYYAQRGFVDTMGLKLVEGRDFNDAETVETEWGVDDGNDPKVSIVTLELAKAMFPNDTSYVGKTFYYGIKGEENPSQIVGVVERLQSTQAATGVKGEYSTIQPARISLPFARYVIRTEAGQRDKVMKDAAEAIRKLWPTPVRVSVRSVEEDRYNRYRNEKAMAWMLIAVSTLLLLVTVSGIVGMTMLRVAQRRKQIGVRRALGARWIDILRYFITENLLITTGGVAAGLLLALGLNRLLIAYLTLPRLPLEYLAFGAGALWVLGVAAVYGPASRAASISPAIATRTA